MLPIIDIFGLKIPMYGLMIVLGVFVGIFVSIKYFGKFYTVPKQDIIFGYMYGLIGLMIGAKLLYICTSFSTIIKNSSNLLEVMDNIMSSGFVFYGGLIGGIIGVFIYSKQFKVSFKDLMVIIVPAVPLIHSFGRIGCLFAGCCHGMEYNGWGHVVFTNSLVAPNNIPFFPIQAVESILNIIIFIVLLVTYKRYVQTTKSIQIYLILYSIVRFCLEFFRGDYIRGIFFGISTSQWISILIVVSVSAYLIFNKKKVISE